MLKKTWRREFDEIILNRGMQYWRSGNVEEIEWEEDCIRAVVSGGEEYDVEIYLTDGQIEEMDCTCPYAEDGNACKHMAAVLYAAENEERSDSKKSVKADISQWRSIVESMSAAELKEMLLMIVNADRHLQEMIVLRKQNSVEQIHAAWNRELKQIIRSCCGSSGYVYYDRVGEFFSKLERFMDSWFSALVSDRKTVMEAFELVNAVYDAAYDGEYGDCDSDDVELWRGCADNWESLLRNAREPELTRMYHGFEDALLNGYPSSESIIAQLLFENEWSEEIQRKNLSLIGKMLEQYPRRENYQQYLIQTGDELMKKLNYTDAQIDAYWEAYAHLEVIRRRIAERSIAAGEYDRAISILHKGKLQAEEEMAQVNLYSQKLIECYRLAGRVTDYRNELEFQIFSIHQKDLEYVKQLHDILSAEEWYSIRKKLYSSPTMRGLRLDLLAYEEKWQQLFELIEKKDLYYMDKYGDMLSKWSAEKVMNYYVEKLSARMDEARTRQQYHDVISYFHRLSTYHGGKETVRLLAEQWRRKYSRKRAMLEELEKAGY